MVKLSGRFSGDRFIDEDESFRNSLGFKQVRVFQR